MNKPETLYQGKYLRLCRRGNWEYAERTNPGGAVIVVAVTPEQRLLLVEQYRIPIQARTIEMPAGLVGDQPGQDREAVVEAAQRELLEETGYLAEEFEFLVSGPSSAGMSTEMMSFVLATGLRRVHAGGGDASEDITVHEIPVADAHRWIAERCAKGYSIDPKLYAGLHFLERHPDGRRRSE